MQDKLYITTTPDVPGDGAEQMIADMKAEYNEDPAPMFMATSSDVVDILVEAIQFVGNEYDTDGIREYILSLQNYEGMSGVLSFDKDGGASIDHILKVFDGEQFIPVNNE